MNYLKDNNELVFLVVNSSIPLRTETSISPFRGIDRLVSVVTKVNKKMRYFRIELFSSILLTIANPKAIKK